MQILKYMMTAGTALALVACGGSDDRQVTLSIGVNGSNANALSAAVTATPGSGGLTLSDGTNTLVITTAEVVLREIELKRDDVSECHPADNGVLLTAPLTAAGDDDPADHDAGDDNGVDANDDANDDDDSCEKFETGARLVTLPLDGTVSQQVVAAVPAGTYDRLEFEIHKLSDDNGSDILRERPDLEDVSIHVEGTFNGNAFVFVSDESFEQRVDLDPPLVVDADGTNVDVTLAIDLAAWFTNEAGLLVDPSAAADHIEDGIDGTFACFEDEDHDGHHDGSDDDGEDHSGSDHSEGS